MRDEPSVRRPLAGGVSSSLSNPFRGRARSGRAREEIAATDDHTGARDRHAATENGRWSRGDCKYEGAILITVQRERVTPFLACLLSLEAVERAIRNEFGRCYPFPALLSFVPRYEIFKVDGYGEHTR